MYMLFHVSDKRCNKGYRVERIECKAGLCDAVKAASKRRGALMGHGITVAIPGHAIRLGKRACVALAESEDVNSAILRIRGEFSERKAGFQVFKMLERRLLDILEAEERMY